MTHSQDLHIFMSIFPDRFQTATATSNNSKKLHNDRISGQTVRNRLQRAVYSDNAHSSVALFWYVYGLVGTDVYSGISLFSLQRGNGSVRIHRRRNERFVDRCIIVLLNEIVLRRGVLLWSSMLSWLTAI